MARENLTELQAFVAVARERSFTRAAPKLDMSRSALSHAISGLEERLGVRLFNRTTRSVSLTEAGARLMETVAPRLDQIEAGLKAVSASGSKPSGTIRITAHDYSIATVLWPRLMPLLKAHPELSIEFSVDYGITDIADKGFDAGVRRGSRVDKDMIAIRIAPDFQMSAAASPEYFAGRKLPTKPADLVNYACINLRLPTQGGLYAWDFERGGDKTNVKVSGQATFNNSYLLIQAALDGIGIAYAPNDLMQPHFESGRLIPVLERWWPTFSGFHLYYANRKHISPGLSLVIDALRWPTHGSVVRKSTT